MPRKSKRFKLPLMGPRCGRLIMVVFAVFGPIAFISASIWITDQAAEYFPAPYEEPL